MKTCVRCHHGSVASAAPPTLLYCKSCTLEVLFPRIRTTMKNHGWYNRECCLMGTDALSNAIITQVKPYNSGKKQISVAAGSSDTIIVAILAQLASGDELRLPQPCLCEDLTPREVMYLAEILNVKVDSASCFWTSELDRLEDNSAELRPSLLAHIRGFVSATNHRERFTPPAALLSILKL